MYRFDKLIFVIVKSYQRSPFILYFETILHLMKGAVHKSPQSGRNILLIIRCGRPHFLLQKKACPHGQKRGVTFTRFCVDVFYGRPQTYNYW